MKKDTVEMLHKVYEKLEEQNEVELLAELKQFVKNVKHTECLLTRGGIIQDKNGKFCTAGDEVIYYFSEIKNVKGKLIWKDNQFFVHCSSESGTYDCLPTSCNFVKVE